MDSLLKLLTRIFDNAIFTDYMYFWIAFLFVIIVFSPIGKAIWGFIKFIINLGAFIPFVLAGGIGINLIYYAHEYKNPVGFFIGLPLIILAGYLFKKYRYVKIIK